MEFSRLCKYLPKEMYALKMRGEDKYWFSSNGTFWWSTPGRAIGAFKCSNGVDPNHKYEVVKIAYTTVVYNG